MALLRCPDCEKMVSPRVQACPFCGCPREFFEESKADSIVSDIPVTDEKYVAALELEEETIHEEVSSKDKKVSIEEVEVAVQKMEKVFVFKIWGRI